MPEKFGVWLRAKRKAEGMESAGDFFAALKLWCHENGRRPPGSVKTCCSWEQFDRANAENAALVADFFGLSDAERGAMHASMDWTPRPRGSANA